MRYVDAPRMLDWLCQAFGFENHLVVPGEHGTIAHAQLVLGNGMIMLGSARKDELAELMRPAREAGTNTQSAYVIVRDVDAHCARAPAAGAEILREPQDEDYGGRGYGARDPEGVVWWFGSYDPWTSTH
jgi:uncharacterized glyoxalase superfamily protein PhnB